MLGGSGKETPGLTYDKGFLYLPRDMVSWDTKTDDIPTTDLKLPWKNEEFDGIIDHVLRDKDGATLMRRDGYSIGRMIATKILWNIATHVSLGKHKGRDDQERRALRLSRTLSPRFVKDYGGRTDVFTAASVCLAHLDDYVTELRDHYPQHYREYMHDTRTPIVNSRGEVLAEPLVMMWSNTLHQERFGGYMLFGGYEEKGFSVLMLQSLRSLTENMGPESFSGENLFARHEGANTTRDLVVTFRSFKSLRYGSTSNLKHASLLTPEDLGLSEDGLSMLADESFERYKKILEKEKRKFP